MTVETFIANREGKQHEILLFLHDLLCNYPHISHKIHYSVPFYKRKKWLCYLNPTKQGGVEMCFIRGYQMANEEELLQAKGRKQITGITFFEVNEIPLVEVKALIQEAILLEDL